jgi:hypothetical protein
MVPVEWPIATADKDGGRLAARVAGGGRLPLVRVDFFLDPRARLTEQERALMTAMLSDLVASLTDDLTMLLGAAEPANDDGEQVFDRLWKTGLLDIPDLILLLLRRAEEERLSAGVRAGGASNGSRFLQAFVGDQDSDISAAAMALILARGRRRDRFDGPRLEFDDLSAEAAVAVVNAIAAGLRGDLVKRLQSANADERLATAVRTLLSRHDEGNRLEARLFELVHAIERAGRLDEKLVRSSLEAGEIALLAEALGRRSGIAFEVAWDHFLGGSAQLALLLRMGGVSRELAGEIVTGTAGLLAGDPETGMGVFDRLGEDQVEAARKWLRLDAAYRSAICALDSDDGQPSV